MKFRTEISIPGSATKITHKDTILTIGSCFAENIAAKLEFSGFNVLNNPFGVLYNPVSIANSLAIIAEARKFDENDLILNQDEYHSFYHHSSFSSHDKDIILSNINDTTNQLAGELPETKFAFISLGTAFVYEYIESGKIVSNCHKIPQSQFKRFRLTPVEVKNHLGKIIDTLKTFNPDIHIIFTVSPVRHLKDGAHGNNLSKSLLLLGIEEITSAITNTFYFPSYELLLDDLRDYRFYDNDLVHPSKEAINYISEKFYSAFLDGSTIELAEKIERIKTAQNHKVRNPHSAQYEKFLNANIKQIEKLLKVHPFLPLQDDLAHFKKDFDIYFTNTK
ncbi:MAG: hypothetical protein SCALA702_03160 [Melioribacteraceae bacterium]|nr:MAG: hypothetical protein SCALA702_03160 [Melioribacteraceae bacterium]